MAALGSQDGQLYRAALFYMVLLLILLSFVAFAVIQLPPGDWIDQFIYYMERFGIELDESAIEALNKRWGFRDPFYVQYWKWFSNIIFRGDFGESAAHNRPVADLIAIASSCRSCCRCPPW